MQMYTTDTSSNQCCNTIKLYNFLIGRESQKVEYIQARWNGNVATYGRRRRQATYKRPTNKQDL